jgi:hypothetical protein
MPATAVERVVIDVMLAASADKSVPVSRDTEVLQVVDSLGLMMGLAKLQTALNIRLAPRETIAALQARSIADLALVLITAMGARGAQPA